MEFFCRRFSVDTYRYRYRYRYRSFLKATGTTYFFVCLPLVYLFFQSSGNAADFSGVLETIKFFFSVRTETNRNSICFGCFSVCFAEPKNIFSVCFGVSDRYRNKHNCVDTNRNNPKKSPKNVFF
jgi:hypothetical protein